MSNKPEASFPKDESQAPLSLNALGRRRALLSGLGKGGAVLAAAVPLQSLAGSTVLTCHNQTGGTVIATVSGSQSAAHSFAAGGGITQVPACGKSVKYWCNQTSWPNGCKPSKTCYKDIFGDYPSPCKSTTTCLTILQNPTSYGDCAHWIAAYFNGATCYLAGAGVFPYPHTKTGGLNGVLDWYVDANKSRAISLFKTIQTADS